MFWKVTFFVLSAKQLDDYNMTTDVDQKYMILQKYVLSRDRKEGHSGKLIIFKEIFFASLNSFLK